VNPVLAFLRQHAVAVLALALVVGGGAAVAVGTTLPKNSVGSTQVKNGSLKGKDVKDGSLEAKDVKDGSLKGKDVKDGSVKGKDVKDGSVTGADLRDGRVTGVDLTDGSVAAKDLADDAVDTVDTYFYGAGDVTTIWSDPEVGTMTLSLTCSSTPTINAFVSVAKSPARGGVYGLEDLNAGGESAGTSPLVGAASVARLGDVGEPVGGAGFGGTGFGFGQIVLFVQTPTIEVYADIKVSLCSARGTVSVNHEPDADPTVVTRPGSGRGPTITCEATGDAVCDKAA
jgi:hypothetical protein